MHPLLGKEVTFEKGDQKIGGVVTFVENETATVAYNSNGIFTTERIGVGQLL